MPIYNNRVCCVSHGYVTLPIVSRILPAGPGRWDAASGHVRLWLLIARVSVVQDWRCRLSVTPPQLAGPVAKRANTPRMSRKRSLADALPKRASVPMSLTAFQEVQCRARLQSDLVLPQYTALSVLLADVKPLAKPRSRSA